MAIILVCRAELLRRDPVHDAVFGIDVALDVERQGVAGCQTAGADRAAGISLVMRFGQSQVGTNANCAKAQAGTGKGRCRCHERQAKARRLCATVWRAI